MNQERSLHILLAEDNPINQQVAIGILQKWGHVIDVAENGLEVLEKLETKVFDLVLMDVQMPQMSGLEATRKIREKEQFTGRHIHIIGLTAQVLAEDRESCLDAGMDDYVPKPIKKDRLLDALLHVGDVKANIDTAVCDSDKDLTEVLDADALALLMGLEAPGIFSVSDLIDTYVETTPDYIRKMEAAINVGDGDMVARHAHAFKGCCQSVGAVRVSDVCERLEVLGKEGRLEASFDVLNDIRIASEVATAALREYIKNNAAKLPEEG